VLAQWPAVAHAEQESPNRFYHQLTPNTTNKSANPNAVDDIIAYHNRTKHHPGHYALGPGGLDWATQPDPFRRFPGSPVLKLPLADRDDTPAAATLFGSGTVPPRPFNLDALGLFFELSMSLSARKEIPGMSWYLRMNPSSGNLHPTEAYAVLSAREWLPNGAGVYHYAPLSHALEQRTRRPLGATPDATGFCVGLTSIIWREAWKYGERAFRYCQHDVGHALAALRYAAAVLGWRVELMPELDDAQLARLLGLDRTEDFNDAERETPELLARVMVNETMEPALSPVGDEPVEWFGRANRLSRSHVAWPVIDEAVTASERKAIMAEQPVGSIIWPSPTPSLCAHSSGQLIRQRRSAVDFDGVTAITRENSWRFWMPRCRAHPRRRLTRGRLRRVCIWCCSCIASPDSIPACISGYALRRRHRHCVRRSTRNSNGKRRRIPPPRRRCIGWAGATCVILRGRSPASRSLLPKVPSAWGCWRGLNRYCGNAARRPTGNYSGNPA